MGGGAEMSDFTRQNLLPIATFWIEKGWGRDEEEWYRGEASLMVYKGWRVGGDWRQEVCSAERLCDAD